MTTFETIRAAGANVAIPRIGSAGTEDGILVYGDTAAVRRAAAVLGLDFAKVNEKVTRLSLGARCLGQIVTDGGRASFHLTASAAALV